MGTGSRSTPRRRTETTGERGAVSVLVLVAVALVLVMGAGVIRLGATVLDRARLTSSADLTALAAVTGGDDAAGSVARANGFRLVEVHRVGDVVEVVVSGPSGTARAAARPAAEERGWSGTGQHGG